MEIVDNWKLVSKKEFYLVHDKDFVDSILDCKKPNGFGNTLPSITKSLKYTTGSFYHAARVALKVGIAISPTSSFHHAGYKDVSSYCTFNGLMVSAVTLQKTEEAKKIGIIDFDMHWGEMTQ